MVLVCGLDSSKQSYIVSLDTLEHVNDNVEHINDNVENVGGGGL